MACLKLGYSVTQIEKVTTQAPDKKADIYLTEYHNYFFNCLKNNQGVLGGKNSRNNGHALAFDFGKYYNPATGKDCTLDAFDPQMLWIINRIKK